MHEATEVSEIAQFELEQHIRKTAMESRKLQKQSERDLLIKRQFLEVEAANDNEIEFALPQTLRSRFQFMVTLT